VRAQGIAFEGIDVLGFRRSVSPRNLLAAARGAAATVRALRILRRARADVAVGTGGYVSIPVATAAAMLRIPLVLHEANAIPGVANRLAGRWAAAVAVSFPGMQRWFRAPVTLVGNPIRPELAGLDRLHRSANRSEAHAHFGLEAGRRTLLVFGGSQGARALNYAVAGALEHGGLSDVNLLWGTGPMHASTFARYAVRGRVVVQGFFDPMARAYRAADLVVCRAGAMTTAEVCAWGKASVLVPLPHAAANHQLHNARALEQCGAAVLLEERDLMGRSLSALVHQLLADPARRDALARAARSRGRPDAAWEVVSKILTLFGN